MCGNASGRGSPAPAMPDVGARLVEFSIENRDPVWVSNLFGAHQSARSAQGSEFRYRAKIKMPGGERQLW